MRASSLSDDRVARLLTEYFVPVLLSRDGYAGANRDPADAVEAERLRRAAAAKGLSHGNVSVYILDPTGAPVDSLIVSQAMEPEPLLRLLRRHIEDKKCKPRDPGALRSAAGPPPDVPRPSVSGGLVVHAWTRALDGSGLGAGEDWVDLTPEECASFVPPPNSPVGTEWDIPERVTDKLFARCYPALCTYSAGVTKIQHAGLSARVVASSPGQVQVALRGYLEADHSRDGSGDGRILASFIGWATSDPTARRVTSLVLASERAAYVYHWKGQTNPSPQLAIAAESVPAR